MRAGCTAAGREVLDRSGGFESTELELLRERFQFHPLAIEDCNTPDQRAKAEEYADHLFIVMHALALDAGDGGVLEAEQVAAFLGERYLVTDQTTGDGLATGDHRREQWSRRR
jgi:Mg2+ and Co2+ transporter CorA